MPHMSESSRLCKQQAMIRFFYLVCRKTLKSLSVILHVHLAGLIWEAESGVLCNLLCDCECWFISLDQLPSITVVFFLNVLMPQNHK